MEIQDIAKILEKYPDLTQRLKEMLDIVESPNRGEFSTADAIEERTVGVVRNLGQNLMKNWAAQQSEQTSLQIRKRMVDAKKHIKKKSTGKRPLEKLK